jgi:hypothetical protein
MMFPRALLGLLSATALAAAGLMLPAASHAEPPLRHVKYTIFSEQPYYVNIYYRDVDPPNWAEYSHNPYKFSPKVEADVGPDQQWNLDVMLADPDKWAMVTASVAGESTQMPNIHCVLAVDGVVVKTHQGPKGALCSIRSW